MRSAGSHRAGYTLVEVLIASGLAALIFGGLGSLLIGTYRLSRLALAETELMLRLKEVRERVLFHAAPAHDRTVWSGVLSGGGKGTEASIKVLMDSYGINLDDGKARTQQIQLVRHAETVAGKSAAWLVNDGDRTIYSWFRPANASFLADDWLDDTLVKSKGVFFLNLESEADGLSRRSRLTVPLFGRVQPKDSTEVFGRR